MMVSIANSAQEQQLARALRHRVNSLCSDAGQTKNDDFVEILKIKVSVGYTCHELGHFIFFRATTNSHDTTIFFLYSQIRCFPNFTTVSLGFVFSGMTIFVSQRLVWFWGGNNTEATGRLQGKTKTSNTGRVSLVKDSKRLEKQYINCHLLSPDRISCDGDSCCCSG